jgi:predicted transcriptional regulator
MKLTSDNETLAKNRALILYILNKVSKPIGNDALLELVLSIENMNYFYFQQFLLDLLENKYILSYVKDHETIYELTAEGKKTLELANDLIPGITKFKVDNNLKEILGDIENAFSVSADFTPESETSYIVRCKIVENNEALFELKTFAGSREHAKLIVDNWTKNANNIYPEILGILTCKKTKK